MSQKAPSPAPDNEKAKLRRRLAELEAQLQRAQAPDPIDGPLSAREALLVEAERIAHLGSWILNLETMEVKWSEELFRILGFDPAKDQAAAEKWFNALHPDDRERSNRDFQRLLAEGVLAPGDFRIVRPDGTVRETLTDGQVVRDSSGKVVRVVGTVLDVTEARRVERERKRLEEQLRQSQKMEVVGRVAGGVAHDFNNLLTVISGNSDLLLEQYRDDKLRRIRDAAEVGAAVTRQLLAFSRQTVAKPLALDLNQVARDTCRIIERMVGEDVTMRLQLDAQPATIFADRGQVQQILLNLAVNARDAMPRGGELLIATALAADKGWVRLTVQDTGTGMDEATRSRAFEPFFTTKEPGQGTGLGLSTVERIVAEAGGEIEIESAPGRGTRVCISFPLHAGSPVASITPSQAPGGSESILLVEDNAPLRELVSSFLTGAGYHVQSVGRPGEAEALWEMDGERIDLLVTDMVMPEKSGRALSRALSAKKPSLKTLFISGYAPRDAVHVPYLQKPFTRGELLHAVRAVCDGRAAGNGGTTQAK